MMATSPPRLWDLIPVLLILFSLTPLPSAAAWPNTPFRTSGRWILDATGSNVTYAGVNWPAHGEVMIPEGLQYQSIPAIVAKIKSLGMNAVRLTYAIEMIDEIYANREEDVTIGVALFNALGRTNSTKVLHDIVRNNPGFSSTTTRLQVFDAVVAECARQEIWVHLDNHVSKAGWCCHPFDGNSWWGDTYFNTKNWIRGLGYMAEHGKSWPNLVSMSLRNELRQPLTKPELYKTSYNWETWYSLSRLGADAIHNANPDPLIFLSGMDSSTNFTAVAQGLPLHPGTEVFNPANFNGYADKLVLEMHTYEPAQECTAFENKLFDLGFQTLDSAGTGNALPLVMTEFGFLQANETHKNVYVTCLSRYLPAQRVGWMIWVLAGSYYVRELTHDYDETWGLLSHDWSEWRSPEYIEGGLKPMVNASLKVESVPKSCASVMGVIEDAGPLSWVAMLVSVVAAIW
ncbi:glycoside hydrolase [Podospora aff. communis PSN243]|uniref:Glycoside hydrolase n=1 Tax=Podospora aff. communis PSN243 TaxID=3040156 RepID=A0AAV9GNI0_9PEZI|nr:glycoside hydrolase [Podospora aff. communis PSN243]